MARNGSDGLAVRNTRDRHRCYSITINNPEDNDIARWDELCNMKLTSTFAGQMEVGKKGTPHLQAWIRFFNPQARKKIKAMLPRAHIEVARNPHALKQYCKKTATRLDNKLIDYLEGHTLHKWQLEILYLIKQVPDERTIHWYWEPDGSVGKTTLARHICIHHKDAIYLEGQCKHVKFAFAKCKVKPRICIFDYKRADEFNIDYTALEALKGGIFFSTKYESGMCIFNKPHIICFANFRPAVHNLSEDMWLIRHISSISEHKTISN